jgi:hypothetical protein
MIIHVFILLTIKKVWKVYQGLPTTEITNFSPHVARVHSSEEGMRNEVQRSITSRDWVQLIPRQLWTMYVHFMSV